MKYTAFPEIEPYQNGRLKVSDIHDIYYEEAGNPKGAPVLFVHGGPGGGIEPSHRRYFDPSHYRIILFDQRGWEEVRLMLIYARIRRGISLVIWKNFADILGYINGWCLVEAGEARSHCFTRKLIRRMCRA